MASEWAVKDWKDFRRREARNGHSRTGVGVGSAGFVGIQMRQVIELERGGWWGRGMALGGDVRVISVERAVGVKPWRE